MSTTGSIPASERPFSPSPLPPRENRHTASRPPSVLLGAPVAGIGTIAKPSTVNTSGLPSTPSPYKTIFDGIPPPIGSDEEYFTSRERLDSGGDDDGNARGRFVRARSMERRDSDSSSTSSSSPQLGATSLLAALASPIPPTVPLPRTRSPRTPHTPHTPPEEAMSSQQMLGSGHRKEAPGSPRSMRSVDSSSSSYALTSSRSFPRLHQPTVVRRPSGRLSFLPPPAQISPSGSSFAIHQPSNRRRSESNRSEGYGSSDNLNRLSVGSLDNLGRFNYGSMKSLGSVVDRSGGNNRWSTGMPLPVGSTESLGRMDFGSMESLGKVMDRGEIRGLGVSGMGSSVESLNRVLAGSGMGRAGRSRDNLLDVRPDMGDIAEQSSQIGREDESEGMAIIASPDVGADLEHGEDGELVHVGRIEAYRGQEGETGQTRGIVAEDEEDIGFPESPSGQATTPEPSITNLLHQGDEPGPDPSAYFQQTSLAPPIDQDILSNEHSERQHVVKASSTQPVVNHPQTIDDAPGISSDVQTSTDVIAAVDTAAPTARLPYQPNSRPESPHQFEASQDRPSVAIETGVEAETQQAGVGNILASSNPEETSIIQPDATGQDEELHTQTGDVPDVQQEVLGEQGISLHDEPDEEKSYSTSRDLSLLATPAETVSHRMQDVQAAVEERPVEVETAGMEEQVKASAASEPKAAMEGEPELNEVSEQLLPASQQPDLLTPYPLTSVDNIDAQEGSDNLISGNSTSRLAAFPSSSYQPPYKPRVPRTSGVTSPRPFETPNPPSITSESSADQFAVTLHATISRARDGPLPFSHPHMELHLAWEEPESYKWVPGRRYIPAWTLVYVQDDRGAVVLRQEDGVLQSLVKGHAMARGVVRGVVGSLPVVWRVAGWI